tara:strand:+ start:992 stop:1309 length:318 start_codon:yes stop_codon:yes gene_type:complete
MEVLSMLLAGLIGAAGMLFLCFKFGVRKVISYDIFFDIAITAVLMYSLAGTYAGMMAALLGGLLVSIILFIMKKTMYHEKFCILKTETFPYRKFGWRMVPPDLDL